MTADVAERTVPAGFVPNTRKSPVTDAWEPLYAHEHDGVVELGLHVAAQHCNARGFLHGGVIASLADNAMGHSFGATVRQANPELLSAGAVTVSLSVDYVSVAPLGSWLEVRPRVVKAGKSMGFVDALILADGEVIARASATFKVLTPWT